jgi:hypothetical protein
MPVMVQIRNVASDLHRELKARAALEGMSLSDYLLRELRHALDRPRSMNSGSGFRADCPYGLVPRRRLRFAPRGTPADR